MSFDAPASRSIANVHVSGRALVYAGYAAARGRTCLMFTSQTQCAQLFPTLRGNAQRKAKGHQHGGEHEKDKLLDGQHTTQEHIE